MTQGDRTAAAGSAETWTCRFGGRDYELEVTPALSPRVVLRVDGQQMYDKAEMDDTRRISLEGDRRVVVRLSMRGSVKRATVFDGQGDLDFDAPPGTRAARVQQWGREHPGWFAMRHVVIKGGGLVLGLLGLGALFKALIEPLVRWIAEHMPRIPWPSFDIPWPEFDIPWPEFDLPRIPWPDIEPPWWLVAFFEWIEPYEDTVKAILLGVVLALVEFRRQRRQRRLREASADPSTKPEPDPTPENADVPATDITPTPPPTATRSHESDHPGREPSTHPRG